MTQQINIVTVNAQLQAIEQQRNAALNEVVNHVATITTLEARVKELEALIDKPKEVTEE